MRILHVYNHFYPCVGGIERYIEDLCSHLIKLGHASDVCCLNTCAGSKKRLKPFEKHKGINIYRIPYKDLKYYKIAPKALKIAKRYDTLHIHGLGFFLDFLSSTKKLHKKPIVLSTHGGIFHTRKIMPLKKAYFGLWSKHKLRGIDKIIAVSRNDEKLFSKISKNVVFIPDGIDYSKYSKIRRKPQKNTLLFIGRLSPNKRIDRLIEIVRLLKKEIPDIKLYVAGDDWKGNRRKLEHVVKTNKLEKNVIFTGGVSEKEKLEFLSKVEFFVSASDYEGFGISVIEAMAAGLPVILNNIEAFRNFVRNGENGFIFDYSKPEKLKNLVLKIKNQKMQTISKNAKNEAKKYDWKELVKKIEMMYKS